jgi:hypothetical protein
VRRRPRESPDPPWVEDRYQAGGPSLRRAVRVDFDLAVNDNQPCSLVHPVLLKAVTSREREDDRAALGVRIENDGPTELDLE